MTIEIVPYYRTFNYKKKARRFVDELRADQEFSIQKWIEEHEGYQLSELEFSDDTIGRGSQNKRNGLLAAFKYCSDELKHDSKFKRRIFVCVLLDNRQEDKGFKKIIEEAPDWIAIEYINIRKKPKWSVKAQLSGRMKKKLNQVKRAKESITYLNWIQWQKFKELKSYVTKANAKGVRYDENGKTIFDKNTKPITERDVFEACLRAMEAEGKNTARLRKYLTGQNTQEQMIELLNRMKNIETPSGTTIDWHRNKVLRTKSLAKK